MKKLKLNHLAQKTQTLKNNIKKKYKIFVKYFTLKLLNLILNPLKWIFWIILLRVFSNNILFVNSLIFNIKSKSFLLFFNLYIIRIKIIIILFIFHLLVYYNNNKFLFFSWPYTSILLSSRLMSLYFSIILYFSFYIRFCL